MILVNSIQVRHEEVVLCEPCRASYLITWGSGCCAVESLSFVVGSNFVMRWSGFSEPGSEIGGIRIVKANVISLRPCKFRV
jgi:hypothetical protein